MLLVWRGRPFDFAQSRLSPAGLRGKGTKFSRAVRARKGSTLQPLQTTHCYPTEPKREESAFAGRARVLVPATDSVGKGTTSVVLQAQKSLTPRMSATKAVVGLYERHCNASAPKCTMQYAVSCRSVPCRIRKASQHRGG